MAPAAKKPKVVYIETPPMFELLDDQYAWLSVHVENCKTAGCEHCWRMDRVREILMLPFRDERDFPIQIHMRKTLQEFIKDKGAGK